MNPWWILLMLAGWLVLFAFVFAIWNVIGVLVIGSMPERWFLKDGKVKTAVYWVFPLALFAQKQADNE